ncbi:hypothetical protein ACFL0H_06000 [Thermodesulfobacteriota bacterium]
MEKIFSSGDIADDLFGWIGKLEALGAVVSYLAYRESDDQALEWHGEQLGGIISDYAKALNVTLTKAYGVLKDYFNENDGSVISDLKREFKILQEGHPCKYAIDKATGQLETIDLLMVDFQDILSLRENFLKLREDIIDKLAPKKSPEDVGGGITSVSEKSPVEEAHYQGSIM